MVAAPELSLVLSTRNPHKVHEVERIVRPLGMGVEPLPGSVELPPEDADTFEGNALGKARAAAAATGRTAIADDSGIEAAALGGAPGVRSARYAGLDATDAANLEKLIAEVPPGSALRYVCALAYVDPARRAERVFFGECRGRMAPAPRGSRGFGYDPVFVPEEVEDDRTMAELQEAEKDAISHRGRALRALSQWLQS
jgi:XTP/dITP diphosphohydrolase